MTTMARKSPTMQIPVLTLISLLLFSAAQCEAFTPPMASRRWSSTLSSSSSTSTVSVDGTGTTPSVTSNNDQEDEAENITTRDFLSLDRIRSTLIRQEETIIFALVERAQFRQNAVVYKAGGVPGLGVPPGSVSVQEEEEELSFLDFMLTGTEVLHSTVRRYESPQEHAFFASRLPKRSNSLADLKFPDLLSEDADVNNINWSKILHDKYRDVIVPAIAVKGDDEQHGSTVVADIAALQALSKRVHFGKFVAESKYRSDPEGFQKLVDEDDADGVMALLTNSAVEEQVCTRAMLKATTYGREPLLSSLPTARDGEEDDTTSIIAAAAAAAVVAALEAVKQLENEDHKTVKGKIDPAIIKSIYRELIIPMTKDIMVTYLFLRCGREPPPVYASDRMSIDVTEL
mmetsp:Transcript_728/g.1518  ORF Transcript_728/g.1518 Transcript_728/m.1518 type:complete len:402 (+) Transcript_728:140-1345(+)